MPNTGLDRTTDFLDTIEREGTEEWNYMDMKKEEEIFL
jgi:hypothetical protein